MTEKIYQPYFFENYIKNLHSIMNDIFQTMTSNRIEMCFIGGVALLVYNVHRMTDDIDILINGNDLHKINTLVLSDILIDNPNIMNRYFWKKTGISIDILQSNVYINNKGQKYLSPDTVSILINGLPYLSLEKLIFHKIDSGFQNKSRKHMDFGDIQRLIKANNLSRTYMDGYFDYITSIYHELWDNL